MIDPVKSWRWYWMSAAVFLIGIISIVLLLWVERISNRLHADEMLIAAVMDIQIHAATEHLRLDEIFRGEPEVEIETAFAGLDQAIRLAGVILDGGESENDNFIAVPLNNPELRAEAEVIRTLLITFKAVSLERLQDSKIAGRGSSLYQQFHSTFREIQIRTRQLEDTLKKDEAEDHKKSNRLLLAIRAIWAFIIAAATAALWSSERQRKRADEELQKANEKLTVQAEELTAHRERLAELVEERTAELASTNEHLRAEISERRHVEVLLRESEKELHLLSARLMTAQETERRSISRELHDELGHALTIIKLRLRSVERGLQGNAGIKDECEGIMDYIDQTIENVRRLSRDLSPAILEDLGLSAAIRWLVDNFNRNFDGNIALDMENIDSLFSEDARIMIYRVLQEAITNIGKHAEASDASVIVRQAEGACTFCIADNGRGLNPPRSLRTDSAGKGLGLAIMEERVRMMGGSFEITSQEGKCTRITFRLPTRKE